MKSRSESCLTRTSGRKLTDDELVNINAASAYEFVDFLSDQEEVAIDELAIWELHRKSLAGT